MDVQESGEDEWQDRPNVTFSRTTAPDRNENKRLPTKDFTHLRRAGDFSDAVIHVGHVSFPVHRNILACSSPYFRALFMGMGQNFLGTGTTRKGSPQTLTPAKGCFSAGTSCNTSMSSPSASCSAHSYDDGGELMSMRKEPSPFRTSSSPPKTSRMISALSNQNSDENRRTPSTPSENPFCPMSMANKATSASVTSCCEVSISDVSPDIMDDVIEHAYGGHVQVSAHNVERLLPAADRFQVTSLLQKCCDFLLSEISIGNCISIVKFANHFFQCEDLRLRGTQFLLDNFSEVFQTSPDFEKLSCEELTSILRADRLNVRQEELVLDAIMRWVKADVQGRQSYIPELVSCARVGLMVPSNMKDFIDSWLVASNYDSAFNMVSLQVMECVLDLQKQQMVSVDSAMFSARLPRDVLFVVGGSNFGYPLNMVEAFDCRTRVWSMICPYEFAPRSYHGMVSLDNEIYIMGGFSGQTYLSSCCKLKPALLTWEDVTPMNTKRCYVGTAVLQGSIYAVGGFDGVNRLNSAERHDKGSNQWSFIAPMLQQRSDAGVAVLDDKLYVCGGFNGSEALKAVEMYDPMLDQWSPLASMSRGRSGLGMVSYAGKLYAVGGFDGTDSSVRLSTMESFDPDSGQWSLLEPMPHARSNLAVEVMEDVLYAIGGFNGERTTCVVECYDFNTNTWWESTRLSHNRSALGACVISGLPNTADILRPGRTVASLYPASG